MSLQKFVLHLKDDSCEPFTNPRIQSAHLSLSSVAKPTVSCTVSEIASLPESHMFHVRACSISPHIL